MMARSSPEMVAAKLLAHTAEWPESWMGDESDLPLGRAALAAMLPFLESLVSKGHAETTLRRHFGNAWMLGGEIVRRTFVNPSVRKLRGRRLLLEFVEEECGPLLLGHATDEEQRDFDATCRKFFRFLVRRLVGAKSKPSREKKSCELVLGLVCS